MSFGVCQDFLAHKALGSWPPARAMPLPQALVTKIEEVAEAAAARAAGAHTPRAGEPQEERAGEAVMAKKVQDSQLA